MRRFICVVMLIASLLALAGCKDSRSSGDSEYTADSVADSDGWSSSSDGDLISGDAIDPITGEPK